HFRVTATNSVGTSLGDDAQFTTAACPPPVSTTGSASLITQTTATLGGSAIPNGLAATGRFEYGTTTGYGTLTPAHGLGSGLVDVAIGGGAIVGLTCGTLYHFRATATNTSGTGVGLDAMFATQPCAPATNAASSVAQTGATLHGS